MPACEHEYLARKRHLTEFSEKSNFLACVRDVLERSFRPDLYLAPFSHMSFTPQCQLLSCNIFSLFGYLLLRHIDIDLFSCFLR
jgi:hypothetical protein